MTEQFEDYQNEMHETFQMLGTKPEEWKWNGADPEECRGPGGYPAGQCKLCGKHPIAYLYKLIHTSGMTLIVGSECVANFVEAAPYSERRKAKDAMQRLMMLNKMTRYLAEKNSISYEEARAKADKMDKYQIKAFFANIERERKQKKLKIRADALGQLMKENQSRLWDQNWHYFRPRTILSSLAYMQSQWKNGTDTPYMDGPMNAALGKLGLELPAKPKLKDIEEQ